MTEAAMVEAVKAAGSMAQTQMSAPVEQVADGDAIARFEAAMGTQALQGPQDIPFASQIAAAWQTAQVNHQGLLHRIKALTELRQAHGPSAAELSELQYEVANLSFQQEVVTNIAKKASDAVSTLVRNG